MTADVIGILFIAALIVGAYFGLRRLAKPTNRTTEEFEQRAAEGTTGMGVFVNALQEMADPAAARSNTVITQMKDGSFRKKRREGKANDGPERNRDE